MWKFSDRQVSEDVCTKSCKYTSWSKTNIEKWLITTNVKQDLSALDIVLLFIV